MKRIWAKQEHFNINLKNAAIDDHNFFFKKPGIFSGQKSSYSADLLKMIKPLDNVAKHQCMLKSFEFDFAHPDLQ